MFAPRLSRYLAAAYPRGPHSSTYGAIGRNALMSNAAPRAGAAAGPAGSR
jgi:hypothetical protein